MKLHYMKPIKEYINDSLTAGKETFDNLTAVREGLFDSEDDLLNKTPDQAIYDYLKSIDNSHTTRNIEKDFSIKDGIIYDNYPSGRTFELDAPLPSYINFDKKSCDTLRFILCYNNITQDQLKRLPGFISAICTDKVSNLTFLVKDSFDMSDVRSFNKIKLKTKKPSSWLELYLDSATPDDIMNISMTTDTRVELHIEDLNSYDKLSFSTKHGEILSNHLLTKLKCPTIIYSAGRLRSILKFTDINQTVTIDPRKGRWREKIK